MNKILIIYNQESKQKLIEDIINDSISESHILMAASLNEGLEIAIREQPDTILLDVVAPEKDIFKLCEKLKSEEKTKNIPLILISSFQEEKGKQN